MKNPRGAGGTLQKGLRVKSEFKVLWVQQFPANLLRNDTAVSVYLDKLYDVW